MIYIWEREIDLIFSFFILHFSCCCFVDRNSPIDGVMKLFDRSSPPSHNQSSSSTSNKYSLSQRVDFWFLDYSLIPLYIQQHYLSSIISFSKQQKFLSSSSTSYDKMGDMVNSSLSISDSDLGYLSSLFSLRWDEMIKHILIISIPQLSL